MMLMGKVGVCQWRSFVFKLKCLAFLGERMADSRAGLLSIARLCCRPRVELVYVRQAKGVRMGGSRG